jgi:hypothetical protein
MVLEYHWNKLLYLIQDRTARRTYNLHVWLEDLILEDADVLCPLLVKEVDMFH